MIQKLIILIKKHWPVLLSGIILAALLFRNPYSTRTLIPNFEPFPDSLHYVVPPRCFLQGNGWQLCRDQLAGIKPAVPPLYGVTLLPSFIISSDPRNFYFVNVLLAFVSIGLFYKLLTDISINKFLQLFVLILLVTTYHVYWVPTLAMAENLLLPTFLGAIVLLNSKKIRLWQIAGVSVFAGLSYGSKFAGLPLMTGICFILGLRIFVEHFTNKLTLTQTIKRISAAVLPVFILFLLFGGYKTLDSILNISALLVKSPVTSESVQSSSWFGTQYFVKNFQIYMQAARGESARFLWDFTPLFTPLMAVAGWFGLGYGLTKSKFRWVSATLLLTAFLQIGILATFYSADTRYIYNLFPTILIGITFAFMWLKEMLAIFSIKKASLLFSLICISVLGVYSVHNFSRLRSQIAINLKYAETPWWYISITEMNTFMETYNAQKPESEKQTIVISPIVPYLVDFYTTADFKLLPLDQNQDFRSQKESVWGEDDYSDLIELYKQKIVEGHPIFVAKYGIGNEVTKQNSFAALAENFKLTEVHKGCFDQCDILKLELKEDSP